MKKSYLTKECGPHFVSQPELIIITCYNCYYYYYNLMKIIIVLYRFTWFCACADVSTRNRYSIPPIPIPKVFGIGIDC